MEKDNPECTNHDNTDILDDLILEKNEKTEPVSSNDDNGDENDDCDDEAGSISIGVNFSKLEDKNKKVIELG